MNRQQVTPKVLTAVQMQLERSHGSLFDVVLDSLLGTENGYVAIYAVEPRPIEGTKLSRYQRVAIFRNTDRGLDLSSDMIA